MLDLQKKAIGRFYEMSNYDEATFEYEPGESLPLQRSALDNHLKDHTQVDRKRCINRSIFCGIVTDSQPKEWN